jgi:hypothetical protein
MADTSTTDGLRKLPSRSDLALWRQAGKAKWEVPAQVRDDCQLQIYAILTDPHANDRLKIAAARCLDSFAASDVAAERVEIARAKLALPPLLVDARTALVTPVDQLTPDLWPLRSLLDACLDDPARFQREVLGRSPWSKQVEVCDAVAKTHTTVVPAGRAVGKSFLLAGLVLWWLYTRPQSLVITTGPDHRQVVSVLWKELRRCLMRPRMRLGYAHRSKGYSSPQRLTLLEGSDWGALGFAADQPEGFSGQHAADLLVIVDEASGIKDPIWSAIHGLAATRLVVCGNPIKYDCHFRELHDIATKGSDTITSVTISSLDSPDAERDFSPVGMASRSFLNQMREIHGENSPWWYSNILGQFPGQDSVRFIPTAWLDACTREVRDDDLWSDYPCGHTCIGVDIGGGVGADRSVVVVRNKKQILEIFASEWHGVLDDARHRLEPVVLDLARRWNVAADHVIYDKAGLGRSFGSYLAAEARRRIAEHRERHIDQPQSWLERTSPQPFEGAVGYFGAGKGGKLYVNRRTACAFALKRRLDPHRENHVPFYCGGLPDWPSLRQELAELRAPTMEMEEGEVKQIIEDKGTLMERLKRSPDLLDALLMTFNFSE